MQPLMMEVVMYRFTVLAIISAAVFASACTGSLGYTASVSNAGYGPDLVYAAPGVQVIADYDEPIFYSDSYYWRYDGGTWYRSNSYTGGWAYAAPPSAVLRINSPRQYVHYRPQGWVDRRERAREPAARERRDDRRRIESRDQNGNPSRARQQVERRPTRPAQPPERIRPRGDERRDHDHDHGDHGK
jgi:hypothetical protein